MTDITPEPPQQTDKQKRYIDPVKPMSEGNLWLLVVVIVVALLVMIAPLVPAITRPSAAFREQAKVAYDAIGRYESSHGLAVSLAELEMKRELDALDRLAHSEKEQAIAEALRKYRFAVQLVEIDDSDENKAAREKAQSDVSALIYR